MTAHRTHLETLDGLVDSGERRDPSSEAARLRVGSKVQDLTEPDSAGLHRVSPGEILGGKYRLVSALGEGGMGSVWLADYEDLDIKVAIKLIRADLKGVPAAKLSQRMQQEARATAKIGHPAIVRIMDVGVTAAGDAFCVMELLEGQDLGVFLEERGRLNAAKAVQVLLPVAHALSLAHEKGIVHRDLKPENIFLAKNADGTLQPKLIDFGIAKIESPKGNDRITQGGTLLGSPAYMSPEQGRGKDVDLRGDIWAFCVALYEVVSGRHPFVGENYHALLRSIIEDPAVPLPSLGVGDARLWSVIERGLAKNPDERWQSMRDLGCALAEWLLARGVREDICHSSLEKTWRPRPGSVSSSRGGAGDPLARLSAHEGDASVMPPPSLEAHALPSIPPPPRSMSESGPQRSLTPLPEVAVAAAAIDEPRRGARVAVGAGLLLVALGVGAYVVVKRAPAQSGAEANAAPPPAMTPETATSMPSSPPAPIVIVSPEAPTSSPPPEPSASAPEAAPGAAPKPKAPWSSPKPAPKPTPAATSRPVAPPPAPTTDIQLKRPTF